jgi:hypothetical protein
MRSRRANTSVHRRQDPQREHHEKILYPNDENPAGKQLRLGSNTFWSPARSRIAST